jgi:hypothetical protein
MTKRYRIKNWSEYNKALIKRGSLTVWVEDGAIEMWMSQKRSKKRGRPEVYSDEAIIMLLVLREVYHLPLRAMQGLAASIFALMGLDLPIPCYTQVCRRAKKLEKVLKKLSKKGRIDIVFDSTGLKVYGEGEWKVRSHGAGKRRTWKKLHIGIDPDTQEIVMCELTGRDGGDAATAVDMLKDINGELGCLWGDGAYDGRNLRELVHEMKGEMIVPPPKNATYKGAEKGWERERDKAIAEIVGLGEGNYARTLWKKLKGYHLRSLVETAMYRLKQILGASLKSRCDENQRIEAECKCLVLNKMTKLGLPKGVWEELIA